MVTFAEAILIHDLTLDLSLGRSSDSGPSTSVDRQREHRSTQMNSVTKDQLDFLRTIDTPTVCNLIEMVVPKRRGSFYTVKHLHCAFPDLPPMVGFAKTVTIKAKDAFGLGDAAYMGKRFDYLDYVAAEPCPSIMLIEDIDGEHCGYGAYWGEVQSNIHKALGCLGTVTNGSVRDIPMIAEGFQLLSGSLSPSHAYVHVVDYGVDVTIHGMAVRSGELVHADRHGAVVVPVEQIAAMKSALDELTRKEAVIIAAARAPGATAETIKAAIRG
jgi:regulator of RNase E activity RraA